MWIIPKNLHTSHSALGTEALISDSSELSEMCAQSLLWRSRPSPARIWSQRWRRVSWMRRLSGRILKPSRGSSFAKKWTSSLEASLVSRSLAQESKEETKIPVICGHTSEKESDLSNLPLFSWRMSRGSSTQNSKEITGATQQGPLWLSMSSAIWKGWVIAERQAYSQRKRSAHLIRESEYSLWLSPRAGEGFCLKHLINIRILSGAAWEGEGAAYRLNGQKAQLGLSHQVIAGLLQEEKLSLSGSHLEQSADNRVILQEDFDYGLNTRWVEALMGLPIGWVDPLYKDDLSACTSHKDELRILGNGVVPQTAERAIKILLRRLLNET